MIGQDWSLPLGPRKVHGLVLMSLMSVAKCRACGLLSWVRKKSSKKISVKKLNSTKL